MSDGGWHQNRATRTELGTQEAAKRKGAGRWLLSFWANKGPNSWRPVQAGWGHRLCDKSHTHVTSRALPPQGRGWPHLSRLPCRHDGRGTGEGCGQKQLSHPVWPSLAMAGCMLWWLTHTRPHEEEHLHGVKLPQKVWVFQSVALLSTKLLTFKVFLGDLNRASAFLCDCLIHTFSSTLQLRIWISACLTMMSSPVSPVTWASAPVVVLGTL